MLVPRPALRPLGPVRMPRPPLPTVVVLLLGLLPLSTARAQDSHYNTNQYGSESALRSGAATAGVRDTSAVWYNPGGLGYIENPSLSVGATAYRLGVINLGDFVGTGKDLKSTPLTTVPLLVSGMIMDEEALPGHRFAFSLINRTIDKVSTSDRLRTTLDAIDHANADTAGDEDYVGSFDLDTGITEIWAGFGWGYKVHENVSIGATVFGALRQQSAGYSIYGRAVNPSPTGEVATSDLAQSYDYLNLRLLGRIGFALEFDALKIGLTVTSPSFNLYGSGGQFFQFTFTNVDIDADDVGDSLVLEDRQEGLFAYFASNMSIALGLEYTVDEVITFAADVEWHAAAGRFNIMNPEATNLELGSGGGPAFFTATDFTPTYRYTTVVNVDFTTIIHADPAVDIVVGFATDFSYAPDEEGRGVTLIFSEYDIFHISSGIILTELGDKDYNRGELVREVSIGVVISFGNGTNEQFADFSSANESNFLIGLDTTKEIDVSYFAFAFVLGFTQHF